MDGWMNNPGAKKAQNVTEITQHYQDINEFNVTASRTRPYLENSKKSKLMSKHRTLVAS